MHLARTVTLRASADPAYVVRSIPSHPHDWSRGYDWRNLVRTHGRRFIDGCGRVCNLRVVNTSGNCELYVPL